MVDSSINVPSVGSAGDVFSAIGKKGERLGTLQFNNGAKLKLSDGSAWARDINVGNPV